MLDDATREVGDKVLARLGFAPTDLLHQRLGRVVQNRMNRLGHGSLDDYLILVERDEEEMGLLAEALTINETYLFREPRHFEALRQLLPEIARTTDTIRILSAACASGEEAYSLAITASQSLSAIGKKIEVVGVDIDGNALTKARLGLYSRWSFRDEGLAHAHGFVRPEGDRWRIVPRIRQLVRFEQANLIHAAPAGPFHIIFCRNILMYLTPDNRQNVVSRLINLMPAGGGWFLGSSETLDVVPPQLERVASSGTYFFRKRDVRRPTAAPAALDARAAGSQTRVILATKSPMFRVVVRQVLRADDGIEIASEVSDLCAAAERATEAGGDVIVTDIVERPVSQTGLLRLRRAAPLLIVLGPDADASGLGIDIIRLDNASPTALRTNPAAFLTKVRLMGLRSRRAGAASVRQQPVAGRGGRGTGYLGPKFGRLLVIGCSTGGPAAATQVLEALPAGLGLAVLVVQHMPAGFTASFAERLNRLTTYEVSEAANGVPLLSDTMYVAPGGLATLVRPNGSIQIVPHDAGDVYVPNINRTFRSIVAAGLASRTIAVVMTGMGNDGAEGMAALEAAGAETIIQHPDEAVVPGMVQSVIAQGAGKRVLLLGDMADAIAQIAQSRVRLIPDMRAGQGIGNRSR